MVQITELQTWRQSYKLKRTITGFRRRRGHYWNCNPGNDSKVGASRSCVFSFLSSKIRSKTGNVKARRAGDLACRPVGWCTPLSVDNERRTLGPRASIALEMRRFRQIDSEYGSHCANGGCSLHCRSSSTIIQNFHDDRRKISGPGQKIHIFLYKALPLGGYRDMLYIFRKLSSSWFKL